MRRKYQCTLCDRTGHNIRTCSKNPKNIPIGTVADTTNFDVQADIEEEFMVLSWMHFNSKHVMCNDA